MVEKIVVTRCVLFEVRAFLCLQTKRHNIKVWY